jgi:hypothetical protein
MWAACSPFFEGLMSCFSSIEKKIGKGNLVELAFYPIPLYDSF